MAASGSGSGASAKWTEDLHRLFVEVCVVEVIKGNRVGTSLNKEGWATIYKELREAKCPYSLKQLKNHWDAMKADYQLFKKLKFGESGLGWNENTKTLEASPMWWLQKTQENPKIGKFKNKDLSLFMQYYDTLFGDIVATGQRAKAATTYSAVNLEVGEEYNEQFVEEEDGKEGSGDSEENMAAPSNLFPSSSFKSGKSSGSKRKKSGAEVVREGLDGLVAAISCKSTSSTAATKDESVFEALEILDNMEEVDEMSELYTYGRRYLLQKGNRLLWKKARNNSVRYNDLLYSFNNFNKGRGN